MARLWPVLLVLSAIGVQLSLQMTIDPDRIAARMRIDAEIDEDYAKRAGRNRRQLGQPKEVTIQVTAPLFSSRLFEYGDEVGDQELPASLDVAKKVQLTRPISFYGKQYSTVYILSNGAIAFDTSMKSHQSKILPSNLKLVAPYWNRNDLRAGSGHVYYREVTSGRVLERGQSEIRYQYDINVKPLSCLLVTWDKMQPMGVNPLNDENTNTFQAAIFSTTNGTFANFIYNNIGWTQAAEAGFNGGEGTTHYALPTSGTDKIMYLEEFGNTGIPGEWMFEIGNTKIQRCKVGVKGDTCDEACGNDEWGADCAGCCHCMSGAACHNITGECSANIGCSDCWTGDTCQTPSGQCREDVPRKCALNAISLTDHDRCGDPIQKCQCLEGYEGDGQRQCRDIDECSRPDICHPKASCTNTPGQYFCQCLEGFSGDGIKECNEVSTFLYPHSNAKPLPRARGAKMSLQLRNPLMIFGERRDQLIISTNGLITVDEPRENVSPDANLDDMNLLGIAPFFANIDLTRQGEVTVAESTTNEVLARANQVINDNLESGDFTATSVIIVTYMNVSAPNEKSSNTYQTLLIGGKDSRKQPLTFAQFLYKDLIWSNGAEAGIMTSDKSNSIQLPGSGTQGIEQLSELSNVRTPGIWLYRVDRSVVDPCIQPQLQPPYCDAQSPTLVNHPLPHPTTIQPRNEDRESSSTSKNSPSSTEIKEIRPQTIVPNLISPEQPQTSLPTLIEVPIGPDDLLEDSFSFKSDENTFAQTRPPPETSTRRRPTPAFPTVQTQRVTEQPRPTTTRRFESTSHQPIVAFKSTEFNEIPPDVFEPTFAPFLTVIPSVFNPKSQEKSAERERPNGRNSNEFIASTTRETDFSDPVTESRINQRPDSREFEPHNFPQPPSNDENDNSSDDKMEVSHRMEILDSSTAETTSVSQPIVENVTKSVIQPAANATAVFLFTTARPTPPKKVMQTRPKLITASTIAPATKKGEDDDAASSMPFDENRVLDAEMSSNRLAILIPVSIVAIWLIILIVIAVVLCCQRRRTHHSLRTMYGPAYQIRPVATAYTMRDPNPTSLKHYDNGIFEDNMEKSSRMNQNDLLTGYNSNNAGPGGRMSLYGSYWNLSTNSSRSNVVDHLPHMG